ncbi:aminoglycoside 6'-N-acetyltransferase I [Pseudorhizobium tarimense]|uniref:Aminoglycoside N(6')-acetyltransferase type 1 n=1 Tax=Pseudorhizobium tarimense TaxID=1079109 RepID=A0ABV2H7F3_9HYPH|nr:GNAT family N-acetyltransferase [Pseudorhizobium tarimense]MCJ8519692.1 GNAT family N-acetyltransferase [Pseudorhizobium tarimense]
MPCDLVSVRLLTPPDFEPWSALRHSLWSDQSAEAHLAEIEDLQRRQAGTCYGAFRAEVLIAFAEISIRPYANGCTSTPVPFLEGIFVEEDNRRMGIARLLLAQIEADLRAKGYVELCSDAEMHNISSHRAHQHWGFIETERVIYFRKPLGRDPRSRTNACNA